MLRMDLFVLFIFTFLGLHTLQSQEQICWDLYDFQQDLGLTYYECTLPPGTTSCEGFNFTEIQGPYTFTMEICISGHDKSGYRQLANPSETEPTLPLLFDIRPDNAPGSKTISVSLNASVILYERIFTPFGFRYQEIEVFANNDAQKISGRFGDHIIPSTDGSFFNNQAIWYLTYDGWSDFLQGDDNTLSFTFSDRFNNELASFSNPNGVHVIGKEITETLGTTETPEIPNFILRAPPGDQSFSTYEMSKSICSEQSFSYTSSSGQSAEVSVEVSTGFDIPVAPVSVSASISASYMSSTDVMQGSNQGIEICQSFESTISNSGLGFIGSRGDLYIGTKTTYDYGPNVSIECCDPNPSDPNLFDQVKVEVGLGLVPKESTDFAFYEADIADKILPELADKIANPLDAETRAKDEQAHRIWTEAIAKNQAIRSSINGTKIGEKITIPGDPDGNSTKTAKIGTSKTQSTSTEVAFFLSTEALANASFGVETPAGSLEVGASVGFSTNMSRSSSETQTTNDEKAFSYSLEDDDMGDNLNVNIFRDNEYGGFYYQLLEDQSQSSCPYEGGYQLDQPELLIKASEFGQNASDHIEIVAQEGEVVGLYLEQINNSNSPRDYRMEIIESGSAMINLDDLQLPIPLSEKQNKSKFFNIKQPEGSNAPKNYEIKLRMFPDCSDFNSEVNSEVTISLSFVDYCNGFGVATDDIDEDGVPDACDVCPDDANRGMHFDGTGDLIEVPSSPSLALTEDFTIEAWINPTDFIGFRGILGKVNGGFWPAPYDYYLLNGNGKPRLYVGAGSGSPIEDIVGDEAPDLNVWTHIAVVKDGNTITHYKNGLENGSGTISVATMDANTSVRIGTRQDGAYKMKGSLDEIRIWNVARKQAEIIENMDKEISSTTAGLAAYYPLNEGVPDGDNSSITTIVDITANNNNGVTNIAKIGTTSNWVRGRNLFQLDSNGDGVGDLCSAVSTDCNQSDLNLGVDNLSAGTYSSVQDLYTSGTIPAGTNVTFLARSIIMDQNFQIAQTGILTANVGDCSQ